MKTFLSKAIILISIILGLYVGICLMFIGGIMQIINSINPLDAFGISIGICRIVFCELATLIPYAGYIISIYWDQ